LLKADKPFVVALARKTAKGSGSSKNIYRLLDVEPAGTEPVLRLRDNRRGWKAGLFCMVIGDCPPAASTSDAQRSYRERAISN
jgi:hypothetical protein